MISSKTLNGFGFYNVDISAIAENAERITKYCFGFIIENYMIIIYSK
jgi:hypothetical protein